MNGFQLAQRRWRYMLGSGSVILLTVVLTQVPIELAPSDIALLYVLLVIIGATMLGRGPAIVVSLLAFLTSNYFFVVPRYSFAVAHPADVLRLAGFLIVALTTSGLAGRMRQQTALAQERTDELAALYSLSQMISAEVDLEHTLPIIAQTTAQLLDVPRCTILLVNQTGVMVERAGYGVEPTPARRNDTFLRVGARVLGVLRVTSSASSAPLTPTAQEQLQLFAGQIILVVERAQLAQAANETRTVAEANRLKSVLLTSVSHDFRTPLAVIKAAVTNLLDESVAWDAATRRDFLSAVNGETDRLNRLVGNLLEMARIEGHALPQTRTWQDVGELVELVLARMQPVLAEHTLSVAIAPDLPLVPINTMQFDQIITNVVENAAHHTPAHTCIEVSAQQTGGTIQIIVSDAGPGIPQGMQERIFERFMRVTGPEQHAVGSGLGLAIARGLVEAHGGQLRAENRPTGGAQFRITLPIPTYSTTAAAQRSAQKVTTHE